MTTTPIADALFKTADYIESRGLIGGQYFQLGDDDNGRLTPEVVRCCTLGGYGLANGYQRSELFSERAYDEPMQYLKNHLLETGATTAREYFHTSFDIITGWSDDHAQHGNAEAVVSVIRQAAQKAQEEGK